MDTKRIVIKSLLLRSRIEIRCSRLFESHAVLQPGGTKSCGKNACPAPVAQLKIRQAHVQIGILRHGILWSGSLAQTKCSLGIDSGIEVTHTQAIHGVPCRKIHGIVISLEQRNSGGIILQSVMSFTGDTLHLWHKLLLRISLQIRVGQLESLPVIVVDKLDICQIIRSQCRIFRLVLHGREPFPCLVIALFHIVNVSQVVTGIGRILAAGSPNDREPDIGFVQVIHLQVRSSQTQRTFIALGIAQQIDVDLLIRPERSFIVSFEKVSGTYQRLHPVPVTGFRIGFQVHLQLPERIRQLQLVRRTCQHIIHLLVGNTTVLILQITLQSLPCRRIIMTFEQDFSIFEQTLRTRQRFGLLCGHRQRKSTKQPRNPFLSIILHTTFYS